MADTPKIGLPEMAENQASKYVTSNSQMMILDSLVQCTVLDNDLDDAPSGPADGDTYIVGSPSSGDDWDGHDNDIAYYENTAWAFREPEEGWLVYVQDENKFYVYNGSSWVILATLSKFTELSDTPASMSGNGYKLLRVNSGQSAIEYVQHIQGINFFFSGKPTANQVVFIMGMVQDIRFGDDFYWSEGECVTAPSDSGGYEFDVQVDGSSIGSINFANGSTSATFTTDSGQLDILRGEVIKIIGQATPDPDMEDIGINLRALII